MFDFPALDVAIGLLFLYLLLALVCSTANEAIMTGLGMRARFLQLGLLNLLSATPNPTKEGKAALKKLYDHPLVQTLVRPNRGQDPAPDPTEPTNWWRKPPYPSYLPSRTFVAALVDLARDTTEWQAEATTDQAKDAEKRIKAASESFEKSIASIPNTKLSEALLAVYRSAGSEASKFHHAAEQWFDDAMERVSGWYKRRVQVFLFVIATFTVVALNADTLTAGRVLWRDDAVRAAVVKNAESATAGGLQESEVERSVKKLDLPLGWDLSTGDGPTEIPNDVLAILAKLLGLGLTIGAVMLGAPFWFDLLSKIMRVRSTGAPPPASDAVRTGDADQARAGPGAEVD
jgi:hypothetical protein